jgi:sugar lactone lactonase YvrE
MHTAAPIDSAFAVHDAAFLDVLGPAPRLERVVRTDAHEGPVYVAGEDALYFTTAPRPGPGEVLHDMTAAPGEDAVDGIKVDRAGHLYVCGPGGIWVLSAEGERLGLIGLPEDPHNLAWGDADARSLYVTALTSVYRIRLGVPGIRPL